MGSAEEGPLAISVTVYSMAGTVLVDRALVPAPQCATVKELHASIARNLPAPAHGLYYTFASPRFSGPIFAIRLDADTGVTQDNDALVSELCVGGPLVDGESIAAQVAILRSELGQVLEEEAEAFAHAMEGAQYTLNRTRAWWESEQADLSRQVREESEAFAHAMEGAQYTLKPCQEQCFATRADCRAWWGSKQADLCRQVREEREAFQGAMDGAEYACPCGDVCSEVFRSRGELAEHLRDAHPQGIKVVPCGREPLRQLAASWAPLPRW